MAWQDEVAQLRDRQLADKQATDSHDESISAVKDSGSDIISALLDTQTGKKDVHITNHDIAKKDDIDKIVQQLKELHLTTLLEANKPHQMNITDSAAYIGDSIDKLSEKILTQLNDDSSNKVLQASIAELKSTLVTLKNDIKNVVSTKHFDTIKKAIDNIEVNPVVNIAAPKITIPETKIDLSPLQATLEHYFSEEETEEKINLDDYRAQDIDNTNPNIQYIGFLNPSGNWYIIENDVLSNRMRYLFGKDDYEGSFSNASLHIYSLLNEAVNALST